MGTNIESFRVDDLEFELREARSEIRRHHIDFDKIRGIIEDAEAKGVDLSISSVSCNALRMIRDVVG